ncbi:MAG TPA: efflux RND transporter periplasmic adaptor subunit [Bryobacteraceae bacterium]|nr:efflux RND transporter periplasmic adaptor subunit [Bryobacteraceae bacterium]
MRSRTVVLILGVLVLAAFIAWGVSRKTTPPEVPFAKANRETIVSTIPTNGKVEPVEWATARAGRPGVVTRILVHRGQMVNAGDPLVELDTSQVSAGVAAAGARVQEAQAQESLLNAGGRAADLAEMDSGLAKARYDLETAQRDADALQRLEAKQAATHKEVLDAQERVKRAQLEIASLEKRRTALVSQSDKAAAQARVNEARASEEIAKNNMALSAVRAPVSGTVYEFALALGAFLQTGDLVANVGRLDRVRVKVYVDEPDLGRIGLGMPVTITWDARPGRKWKGEVDRLPTEVVPLGTRQVGEVGCVIGNPEGELVPGTNVNAEIQSKVVKDAVTAPREALRRQNGDNGMFVLGADNVLEWRPVQLDVTSAGRVQVVSGINAGDSVALPTEKSLKTGMKVTPVYP